MLAGFASTPATAGPAGSTLRVTTLLLPPYVMPESHQLTGFSIGLGHAVAETMKVKTDPLREPDVNAVFSAVASNKADAGGVPARA